MTTKKRLSVILDEDVEEMLDMAKRVYYDCSKSQMVNHLLRDYLTSSDWQALALMHEADCEEMGLNV